MIADEYKTVRREASSEFTEKKSVFISYISPITTENDAHDFIEKISRKNASATHNVYAYINREGNAVRFSDAGEPQGTAGMPVLEVLKREELYGVVVVVTRFFGGILLGAGGLVRAYSRAAADAVEAAGSCVFRRHLVYTLKAEYSDTGKLNYELPRRGVKIHDTEFSEKITYTLITLPENAMALASFLSDISSGRLRPELTGERFDAV